MYIREDQALITVTIDGTQVFDKWATYSGGELVAASQKTRPGGMGSQVSVGGPASRSDITCTIQATDIRIPFYKSQIEDKVGWAQVSCNIQYLDTQGNALQVPNGNPKGGKTNMTRTGTLKHAQTPNGDANAEAVGFITIMIDCNEEAS